MLGKQRLRAGECRCLAERMGKGKERYILSICVFPLVFFPTLLSTGISNQKLVYNWQ